MQKILSSINNCPEQIRVRRKATMSSCASGIGDGFENFFFVFSDVAILDHKIKFPTKSAFRVTDAKEHRPIKQRSRAD